MKLPLCFVALLFFVIPLGCSSVPDFKPSTPVEKAANFQDALDVCASYQIKCKDESTVKVATMVPWIRCLETTFQVFPQALQNRHFVIFFRALQIRHDAVVAPHDLIHEPARLNKLVKNALAMIKSPSTPASDDDYRYAQRELPRYASYLEERSDIQGAKSRAGIVNEELGPLSKDYEDGLHNGASAGSKRKPPRPKEPAFKQYCTKYFAFLSQLSGLKELIEYKDILSQQNQDDPSQLLRVQKRVDVLKAECLEARQQLAIEKREQKAKTSGFDNADCFR